MKIKKILLAILLSAAAVSIASAETVYLDELQTAADAANIVFENYSGPHNTIDTVDAIRGIGIYLGSRIGDAAASYSYFGKYRVIHAVDPAVTAGLDADIFIVEPSATVDHIKNLRRMIAGFLEAAYDYEPDQADLLAEFVTVYNAVHRSDLDYFRTVYKEIVLRELTSEKAGLALSYKEWPGRTMILIPLTPQAGSDVISDLNTDILSDEDVIKQLQSQDDKGIESRQGLVDLKDKEVAQERANIEQDRQDIQQREQAVDQKKQDLAVEAEQLAGDTSPEAAQRRDEISQESRQAAEEEKKIADEKTALDQREKAVEDREQKIVDERAQIAEDQTGLIEAENKTQATPVGTPAAAAASVKTVPFLKISGTEGNYSGRILLIDSARGSIVKQSETDSIRLRGYRYDGKSIISVAGSSGGNRIVSIVMIDPATLDVTKSGTAEVYTDSAIAVSSGKYYAVVSDSSQWKVGIFDSDLKLTAVSPSAVFPATDIVISGGNVIAQDNSGRIVRFEAADFTDPSP